MSTSLLRQNERLAEILLKEITLTVTTRTSETSRELSCKITTKTLSNRPGKKS